MSEAAIYICQSAVLEEGGRGVRFPLTAGDEDGTGFVIRFDNNLYGYLNRCAHVPIELDWTEGEFFESSGLYLMCATHGALYAPENGKCAGGPCRGGRLHPINVFEKNDQVFWLPNDYLKPARA